MNAKSAEVTPLEVDAADLEQKVKEMYRSVAENPHGEFHFEMGRDMAVRLGYPTQVLDHVPAPAIDSFAGVGYHFHLADLQPAESVLDLGSGSGMDTFFAAIQVGQEGRVVGVDMTDAQREKAEALRNAAGFANVSYLKGYIQAVPCEDATFDAVISNGVINLAPNKHKVFQEAARLLKPGGRLALADIVTGIHLPAKITCDATLWAACIGGAMQIDDYVSAIKSAGLTVEKVQHNPEYRFLSASAQGATRKFDVKSISILAHKSA